MTGKKSSLRKKYKALFKQAVREGEDREKGINIESDAFLKFQANEIRSEIASTNRLKKLMKNVKKAQKKK